MTSAAGTFALTFDNLGEAAELELGVWPAGRPIGRHRSVERALPRILDVLGDVPATFFVEAWNCEHYPAAIRAIAARGDEVAVHGWRHERWCELPVEEERTLLARSLEAFAGLGVRPVGFRPPGGYLGRGSAVALADLGFAYHSAADDDREARAAAPAAAVSVGNADGRATMPAGGAEGDAARPAAVAALPFAWNVVDAYHLEPAVAPFRARRGDRAPGSRDSWRAAVHAALDRCRDDANPRVAILHPYLLDDPAVLVVLEEVVDRLRTDTRVRPVYARHAAR